MRLYCTFAGGNDRKKKKKKKKKRWAKNLVLEVNEFYSLLCCDTQRNTFKLISSLYQV